MKRIHSLLAALLLGLVVLGCSSSAPPVDEAAPAPAPSYDEPAPADPVHLRLLAINDFHGALEGPNGTVMLEGEEVDAGGATYLAAHVADEMGEADHTTFVAAGDLIGASPLTSALFHDEPTIEALNKIGLDIASVGNHEFDQGVEELLRIDAGGCHPDEGCREGHEFEGAQFSYLAANVRWRDSGDTILPPYEIREYGGVNIAYIGMTLENTPEVVVPSAVEDVSFHNEVETVENLLPELREKNVDSVVVVVHEGGAPHAEVEDINDCPDVQGRDIAMARQMPEAVDVIVSGHSHMAYICDIDGRLVTQAASSGRVVTVIDLYINPDTGTIVDRTARQRVVTPDIEPDEAVEGLVDEYAALAEDRAGRVVGEITADLPRGERRAAGESPIGHLIADAQLEATEEEAGAQIAFMNPGGIRDALHYDAGDEAGAVTYAQLHTIQPFNNVLTTITLSGEQIHRLLEQQWREDARPHVLAVSDGFSYVWDPEAPVGERVDPDTIELHGETIDPEAEYRVTINNFLADGGDGFTILEDGTDRVTGIVDLDALADYIERHSPIEPSDDQRVRAAGE